MKLFSYEGFRYIEHNGTICFAIYQILISGIIWQNLSAWIRLSIVTITDVKWWSLFGPVQICACWYFHSLDAFDVSWCSQWACLLRCPCLYVYIAPGQGFTWWRELLIWVNFSCYLEWLSLPFPYQYVLGYIRQTYWLHLFQIPWYRIPKQWIEWNHVQRKAKMVSVHHQSFYDDYIVIFSRRSLVNWCCRITFWSPNE